MAQRYSCPDCQGNQTRYALIKKLAQEVHKDPQTGKIIWAADEWEEVLMPDGQLYLEVRCLSCGYQAGEKLFTQAAKHNHFLE